MSELLGCRPFNSPDFFSSFATPVLSELIASVFPTEEIRQMSLRTRPSLGLPGCALFARHRDELGAKNYSIGELVFSSLKIRFEAARLAVPLFDGSTAQDGSGLPSM